MYDRSIVEKLFTWTIYADLTGLNGVIAQIVKIPFACDELIIKKLTYASNSVAEGQASYLLQCDLPNATNYICTFTVESTDLNIHVPLNGQGINQSVFFRIYDITNTVTPTIKEDLTGTFAIVTEWIKYAPIE